jgi:hypothetical protein
MIVLQSRHPAARFQPLLPPRGPSSSHPGDICRFRFRGIGRRKAGLSGAAFGIMPMLPGKEGA